MRKDFPKLNNIDLVAKINETFDVEFTTGDLYLLEEPTLRESQEDLMLIYKHNNIVI